MSLLDKLKKFDEKQLVSEVETTGNKRPVVRRRTPSKPAKLVVPEHIKILFNNLDKSISSVWGVQQNGKIKWDSKFNQWESFKIWFKEMM